MKNAKLPRGVIIEVAKKMNLKHQTAWKRIHIDKDPKALDILDNILKELERDQKARLKKYSRIEDYLNR